MFTSLSASHFFSLYSTQFIYCWFLCAVSAFLIYVYPRLRYSLRHRYQYHVTLPDWVNLVICILTGPIAFLFVLLHFLNR